MLTQIHLKRGDTGQTSEFYKDLVELCESGTPVAAYAGMLVSYSPYGISCQYQGMLLHRVPLEFRGLTITHVTLEEPAWDARTLAPGSYNRRRAFAIVTQIAYKSRGATADAYRITVESSTLGAANHLFNEIVVGKAVPQSPYLENIEP